MLLKEKTQGKGCKKTKPMSTIDKWLQDPDIRNEYEATKKELVLSELFSALMEEDQKSVRQLAKEAGISPSVIQIIRTGKQEDIKLTNFMYITEALSYHLELVSDQGKQRIPLHQVSP